MKYSFMRFPRFKNKALTLSYDDGVIYDEKLIEIMSKYGLKGTFNINSGYFSHEEYRRLSEEKAKELYLQLGNEVAVHGVKHWGLANLDTAMIANEIVNDRIALEKLFGKIVTGMAYAGGSYDDRTIEVIKNCGIEYARIVETTESFDIPRDWLRLSGTCHHNNPRLMELAKDFVEENFDKGQPQLFYLWGHSYEFNANNGKDWKIIEDFAEYMGNRPDIWYATNGEIYRYIRAFESLKFAADGSMVYNPSALDIYLEYFGRQYIVPVGETIKLLV